MQSETMNQEQRDSEFVLQRAARYVCGLKEENREEELARLALYRSVSDVERIKQLVVECTKKK